MTKLEAAKNLVALNDGRCRSPEWMNAFSQLAPHIKEGEDCDQAAARILLDELEREQARLEFAIQHAPKIDHWYHDEMMTVDQIRTDIDAAMKE
jgi:hypothetical protein